MKFNWKYSLLILLVLFGLNTIAVIVKHIFDIQDTYMLGFIVGVCIVLMDKHLEDKYEKTKSK